MQQTMLAQLSWLVCSWVGVVLAGDYYSSLAHIRHAVAHTEDLLRYLDWYAEEELLRIQQLRLAIHEMKDSTQHFDIEHPVDAYKLIDKLTRLTKLTENSENLNKLKGTVGSRGIPFMLDSDRKGAANAIIRLLRVYNLTIEELLWSPLHGRPATHIEAGDMLYIGEQAMTGGDPLQALSWFSAALAMYEPDIKTRSDILGDIARTHHMFGDLKKAIETVEEALYLDPDNKDLPTQLASYETKMAEQALDPNNTSAFDWSTVNLGYSGVANSAESQRYQALCRGDGEAVTSRTGLYCHYRKTIYPYIRVKEELLSLDPKISLLYEIISETDQQELIDTAIPQLLRSSLGDPSKPKQSEARVSKVAWLWDEDIVSGSLTRKLSRQATLYTGLLTEFRGTFSNAEPFQVNNYGLGGHYEPHYDFYEDVAMLKSLPEYIYGTGERLATYMIYLTDVQAGGATVFPNINVRVSPVKGAAAFWYNLKRSGENDNRTLHAGCPVLVGEKWVANKWIREFGQDVGRPCGLSEDALD